MKKSIIRCYLFVPMILCCLLNVSAQITLHEATNVTQTKATLSAEFPDTGKEHGFQYKYGTLPEIDEFSRVALSYNSDPIQLNTNNWHSSNIKGYIENSSGISGTVTTTIMLYQPTTISFDWSIDAQENCSYLRFCIDTGLSSSSGVINYSELARITGDQSFSNYSIQLSKGIHHLKWEYHQLTPSAIGLDIARIKNITIENTLPGEWKSINAEGNEIQLEQLIPNSNVLYRAFEEGQNEFSNIGEFSTERVEIMPYQIQSITQTTATISRNTGFCEADMEKGVNYLFIHPLLANIVSETTDCSGIKISASDKWMAKDGKVEYTVTTESGFVYGTLTLDLTLSGEKYEKSTVEFDISNEGTYTTGCYVGLFVDNNSSVNQTFKKGTGHYSVELTSGSHSLTFKVQKQNSKAAGGIVSISGLSGENIVGADEYTSLYTNSDNVTIENLKPDHTYMAQSFVQPKNATSEPLAWQGETSQWFRINTLPIIVKADTCNLTQSSAILKGTIDKGNAAVDIVGFKYRALNGTWITSTCADNSLSDFSEKITRLKPGSQYEAMIYVVPTDCDTVFSNIIKFSTKEVIAKIPTIIRLSQHEVSLQGEIVSGDATIYQRGMQFRKKDADNWEEVEDGGENSFYTLVKKNLLMGETYQARTYVQPAGCNIIYSDILTFTTLDNYFTYCNSDEKTQTTITLKATLGELDEGVNVTQYGFEYYIASDGFSQYATPSDVIDLPVTPDDNVLKTIITQLCPDISICWRAYVIIDNDKIYYTGPENLPWNYAETDRAIIKATVRNITQTSISLDLNTQQNGDAEFTKIEYALAKSPQDTKAYSECGNVLTLDNLTPDSIYHICFRGTVNDRLCPLLKDASMDYSWFEYKTLPVSVDVTFSNITQTKATMKVSFNSGDASISNMRYRIDYGQPVTCSDNNNLENLKPGKTYSVTILANVNGVEKSWNSNYSETPFEFTTKSVTSSVSVSEIYQTSAIIKLSSNVGDAKFISSGIEIDGVTYTSDKPSDTKVCNELLPDQTYTCRSYVETQEGGRVYSSSRSFSTKSIELLTLPVSNISNRSATLNGTIDCDDISSVEFGFQWKQMVGWLTDPAFTKGRKLEDGSISVSLVNGMLEPNTDYQYRTAVRYQNKVYYASEWQTFRTESEFIYYPTSVYTIFRTDRENNSLVLCGYYVAGSETVLSQGYEYWQVSSDGNQVKASQSPVVINTDESMHYEFAIGELSPGHYNVRAFVKTDSGSTIYGATLGFTSTNDGYSGMENITSEKPEIIVSEDNIKLINAASLDCYVYSINGQTILHKKIDTNYYEVTLLKDNIYIVALSNGLSKKIKL